MASFLGSLASALGKTAGETANIRLQMERDERREFLREKWYNKEKADRLAAEERRNSEWDRRYEVQSKAAMEQAKLEISAKSAEEQVGILESRLAEIDQQMKDELEATKSEAIGVEADPAELKYRYDGVKNRYNELKYNVMLAFSPDTIQRAGYGTTFQGLQEMMEGIDSGEFAIHPVTNKLVPASSLAEEEKAKKESERGVLGAFAQDVSNGIDYLSKRAKDSTSGNNFIATGNNSYNSRRPSLYPN